MADGFSYKDYEDKIRELCGVVPSDSYNNVYVDVSGFAEGCDFFKSRDVKDCFYETRHVGYVCDDVGDE